MSHAEQPEEKPPVATQQEDQEDNEAVPNDEVR